MNTEYELRLKDIDPDTGKTSQDMLLVLTFDLRRAELIRDSLEKHWFYNDGDPNREFYIRKTKENG
jgi:hypothetical protein